MSITYRSQKGSQLTSQEVDDNFEYLAQQVGLSGLTTPGVYLLIGTELKLFAETWGWSVFGEAVTNIADYTYNVPSVTAGNRRVDVVCGNSTGGILVLSGPAGPVEIEPIIPVNYAKLLKLSVSPEGVNVTSLLGNYISKASEAWTNVIVTGASGADYLFYISENARKLNITGSPNNAVFAGFHASGGSASQLWSGCDLYIKNSRTVVQLLRHNAAGAAVKLFFQSGQDYLLPPKSIAHFIFNFTEMRYEFVQTTSFFVDDIKVSLPAGKSLGKYVNGDTIPAAGKTFEDVLKDIAFDIQNPTFVAPTFGLTHNQDTREVGATVSLILTANFNRGQILGKLIDDVWQPLTEQDKRAGAVTSYVIDGTNTGTTPTKSNSSYVVTLGNNSFSATANYGVGPQPKNNKNENFSTPLAAGSMVASAQFTGLIPYFYGVLNPGQTIDDINLASFTKVVANSNETVSIPWSGISGKLLVVLHPATSTTKTKWYVTELNSGNIGNPGNLFPNVQTKNFNSPTSLWSGVSFKVYISTQTNANETMEFRNS